MRDNIGCMLRKFFFAVIAHLKKRRGIVRTGDQNLRQLKKGNLGNTYAGQYRLLGRHTKKWVDLGPRMPAASDHQSISGCSYDHQTDQEEE